MKTPQNPDVLERAYAKLDSGRGTTNTEKKAIADFESGKIGRDHFKKIQIAPLPSFDEQGDWKRVHRSSVRTGDPSTQIGTGVDRLGGQVPSSTAADIATLTASVTALTDRVAALETLLASYEDTTLNVCISGTATSKVFLTK